MSNNNKDKTFKETKTNYLKDKELINAIVTSNLSYGKNKGTNKKFRFWLYFYALLIFFISILSISMLGVSQETQKQHAAIFSVIEIVVFIILLIDLILRWYTANIRIKKGNLSYLMFPFTIVGLMMILSLLPSLYLINVWTGKSIELFQDLGNMKFLRIFRIILLTNLIPALSIFRKVLIKEKSTLYIVFSIVIITIIVFTLVIYNIEGIGSTTAQQKAVELFNNHHSLNEHVTVEQIFGNGKPLVSTQIINEVKSFIKINNFLDALYFSTVALTTIGFGDITPITSLGRVITIIMSIIGIAVLATPSGVIAGGFIKEVKRKKDRVVITK